MEVLLGKLAIGIACGVAAIVLVPSSRLQDLSRPRFDNVVLGLLFVSRFAVFGGLFYLLGWLGHPFEPTSDVVAYVREAREVLDGKTVYRDFSTSYSPLFPYFVAGILKVWNSTKAVIAATILIELISLPIWLAVGRRLFNERVTRQAALLYVVCPVPLINVAMNGQNQVWQATIMAAALWLLTRRDVGSGLVYGLALAGIKLLAVLFAPVLWLFAGHRWRWLVGFAVLPLVTFGVCLGLGLDVLVPIRIQGALVTSGNLLFLGTLTGVDLNVGLINHAATLALAVGLVAVFLVSWARGADRSPANVMHLLTLVLLTFLLLSKKAYPSYLVLAFFPLCFSVAARPVAARTLVLFSIFGIVAVLEPSLWFRWLGGKEHGTLDLLWRLELPAGIVRWRVVAFLLVEMSLLGLYVWLFGRTWLQFGRRFDADGSAGEGRQT